MFRAILRPGQGFQQFRILARNGGISDNGRFQEKSYTLAGELTGILMPAASGDSRQWDSQAERKQEIHTRLYKIIQNGGGCRAKPTDRLELGAGAETRQFIVTGVHDPGDLHRFTLYFAEERKDLQ